MNASEIELRDCIVEVGRRLHHQKLIAGYDGNVAVRVGREEFLITKTWSSLGYLAADDIVKINANGDVVEGRYRPTGEYRLHLVAFRERPDAVASIHAHPIVVTAFATAGQPIPGYVFPEVGIVFGDQVPVAPYGTPSTPSLAESIAGLIRSHDAVMMARHGAIVVSSKDLFDAYNKLEKMEAAATTLLLARRLGDVPPLPDVEVEALRAIRARLGFAR